MSKVTLLILRQAKAGLKKFKTFKKLSNLWNLLNFLNI